MNVYRLVSIPIFFTHSTNNEYLLCVRLYFWGAPKSLQMMIAAMKLKDTCSFEEMTTHSSILAWEISWTEESGRPQFMGSHELDGT